MNNLSISSTLIHRIESVILQQGARLSCPNSEFQQLNFARVVNNLLHNRAYAVNGGCTAYFFLFHLIYRTQSFYRLHSSRSIPFRIYQAVIDLILYLLKCRQYSKRPVF